MALRTIRIDGDPILRKKSRIVEEINDKIRDLIQDMKDTMYKSEGIGLAAPQVGMLKRIIVVDVTQPDLENVDESIPKGPIVLINPQIIEADGEQIGSEGCLSVPNFTGKVKRPQHIKVRANNENFEEVEFDAKDLFARAICHEIDHLDGILYKDRVIGNLESLGD
ncbi:peptide deformylase [Criibacterium bergeronii]|uniref:Peptide deformylase n=1 Tax=Criibacterium bergeronii TaxID=1871336 RepID=A0A371IJC0_9FIRM|nr:peptide deformylase [Criibacterium bergeronii]MBS6064074.1 peptide deformylase [Peptostreptococcaceae bacterium]RDY20577.1 peptide deformylase [Criibacterium bergeronii]TRW25047.1 peptide deformylase [Criibacterium bergeronii]